MSHFPFARFAFLLVPTICLAQDTTGTVPRPPTTMAAPKVPQNSTIGASTLAPFSEASRPEITHYAKPLRVVRYWNPDTRMHEFSAELEAKRPPEPSFTKEDVPESVASSPLFYVFTERYGSTIPIQRFRARDGSMVFAANQDERGLLRSRGLEEIEEPVFVYDHRVEGSAEVFRIRNPGNGDILYTTSLEEKDYYLKQGWGQLSSLGFAQPTSSSGTGILLDTTVKLEHDDLRLVAKTAERGREILFGGINPKIDSLVPGTIVYAEKSTVFPLGLVAKIASVTRIGSGEVQVSTLPADLTDAFVEFHLYIENRQVYFLPDQTDAETARPARRPALTDRTDDRVSAIGEGRVRPEYLTGTAPAAVTGLPDGAYWSQALNYSQDLYKSTIGSVTSTVHVDGNLTLDATAELIYNGYNACVIKPTVIFLLTPHEHGSLNVTASGEISTSQDKKILGPYTATFTVGGIPISADLTLYAGFNAAASVTASISANEDAQVTAGIQYDLNSQQLSGISCPNPCPSGFTCGPSRVNGATCAFTPSLTGSITADAQVAVYLRPELYLYAGAWGTGIGPTAYAKLQLKVALEPPNLNVYAQLIPGVGAKLQIAYCTVQQWGPKDFDPWLSTLVKSFPLVGSKDADVTSLAGKTVDVQWYYFQAPSGLWYIATSGGNVLALKDVSPSFSGGILWKPINSYPAYAGYPAAGTNFSSVQVASDGKSVRFGSFVGSGNDSEVKNLANTTQQVSWFYFQNSAMKWFIVSYGGEVLALNGVDPAFNGGILWKPINNYSAFAGYPAAVWVYQSVSFSSDGKHVTFGPLK